MKYFTLRSGECSVDALLSGIGLISHNNGPDW